MISFVDVYAIFTFFPGLLIRLGLETFCIEIPVLSERFDEVLFFDWSVPLVQSIYRLFVLKVGNVSVPLAEGILILQNVAHLA